MLLDFCGLQAGQQEVVEKLRELRMTTMVSGASPSPILLTATIRKHLKQHESEYHEVVEMIRTSLYGEDFIASSRSIRGTCSDNYSKGSHVHSCMDLCEWMMNSPKLKEKWKESLMDCTVQPETHGSVLKVLGLVWRPATHNILKERENTKRSFLQSSARTFDAIHHQS